MTDEYNGYIPHPNQMEFKCICGSNTFQFNPQTIDANAPFWVYEHICIKCGRLYGIRVKRVME